MIVSPFQALVKLAEMYKNSSVGEDKYNQICSLLLKGTKTQAEKELLTALLQDRNLEKFTISDEKEIINRDPARRYFESHLAAHTLKNTLDSLDIETLEKYYKDAFHEIPFILRIFVPFMIYRDMFSSIMVRLSETAAEYISAIKLINSGKNFKFLDPENKNKNLCKTKMLLLVKIAHAAMAADSQRKLNYYSLNLKDKKDSSYHPYNRGRQALRDESGNPQKVRSNNLGIMRSFMPVPREDILNVEKPSSYVRPTDKSTYIPGTQAPEENFDAKLLPFVNSVSGTMLAQVRIMSKLVQDKKFSYYDDPEQLKTFFKCFVSYMLFNSGGHSLNEFLQVLQDPDVQEEFKAVAGFNECDIKTLFQEENLEAFESALEETIQYNKMVLAKMEIHREIKELNASTHTQKINSSSDAQTDKTLTPSAVKRMVKASNNLTQKNNKRNTCKNKS